MAARRITSWLGCLVAAQTLGLSLGSGPVWSAAPAAASASLLAPGPAWRWPLSPEPAVVHRFEAPPGPYAAGHRGVDLVASVGQPVLAAGPGVVAFAGQVAGRGVVSVDHSDGLRTTYEPVEPAVRTGETVAGGQVLGRLSTAALGVPGHCVPQVCLHWGLRRGSAYLDPLQLVEAWRLVRLLPFSGPAGVAGGGSPSAGSPPPPRDLASERVRPSPDRGPLMAGL